MEGPVQFSEREKQVIALLIRGRGNKQIALALGISLRTVEFHLSNIYAKLGVTSRTEAALQLSQTYLRESTGEELRESTVPEMDESEDNLKTTISTWRFPVSKSFLIGLGILILTAIICLLALILMATERGNAQQDVFDLVSLPTDALSASTITFTLDEYSHEWGDCDLQQYPGSDPITSNNLWVLSDHV